MSSEPTQAEAPSEREAFEDSRVQAVYDLLCDETPPPKGEHWEGFAARRIVAALATQQAVQGEDDSEGSWKALPDRLRGRGDWLRTRGRVKDAELMFDAATEIEGARAALATPPTPGQVEREREDAENYRWLLSRSHFLRNIAWLGNFSADRMDRDFFSLDEARQALDTAIRASRSGEGEQA